MDREESVVASRSARPQSGTTVPHTPGPWAVEDPMEFELTIVEANKPTHEWRFIASCSLPEGEDDQDFTGKEVLANAYLIASAPDGIKANREAADFLRSYFGPVSNDDPAGWSSDDAFEVFLMLEAAIAKAEGRDQ